MASRRSRSGARPASQNGSSGSPSDPVDQTTDQESLARSVAFRRLTVAPQTRAQLDEAMQRRGVSEQARDRVLDRLSAVGLVDDAQFASMWVESRHEGRGLGRRALAQELRRRGVETSVVDEAVAQIAPEQEEAKARALVSRKLAGMQRLDSTTRARRLLGLLARRGYSPGIAGRVVSDALGRDVVDDEPFGEPNPDI